MPKAPDRPRRGGGYEKRKTPSVAKGDYGRWILWGVLALGVIILSILSLSIAGSLKRKT
jgi:hypothetical protein